MIRNQAELQTLGLKLDTSGAESLSTIVPCPNSFDDRCKGRAAVRDLDAGECFMPCQSKLERGKREVVTI